jgi:hypothetical protein
MTRALASLNCTAVRWVSAEPQPGLIEVELVDAAGRIWTFVDKTTIFGGGSDLFPDRIYLAAVTVRCTQLGKGITGLRISTEHPDYVETVDGTTEFEVRPEQVVSLTDAADSDSHSR